MDLINQNSLSFKNYTQHPTPNTLHPRANNIDLWEVNLDLPHNHNIVRDLLETLSVEEKERANRFYQEKHRQNFIIARGLLRVILGRYMGQKPSSILFKYSEKGKPSLVQSTPPISFNLSHSHQRVIYGISSGETIGVDLEYYRNVTNADKLAERFFSPREYQYIKSASNKHDLFLKLWTAKEAYLKATGEGIAGGLEQVEVYIGDKGELTLTPPWSLLSFIEQNYYIAIATPEKINNICMFSVDMESYQGRDHTLQDEKDDKKGYV